MRHTGVDELEEFTLGLLLVIENTVRDINDLHDSLEMVILNVIGPSNLDVFDICIGLFSILDVHDEYFVLY